MNTVIFKIYVVKKLVFLGGDLEYELDWFLRNFLVLRNELLCVMCLFVLLVFNELTSALSNPDSC